MNVRDHQIIQQCLSGDANAFRFIVEKYQRHVSDTIIRMIFDREIARDLTQEVFVKAYLKLHQFNPGYSFKSWIQRIAINHSIDFIRRRKPEYLLLDKPVPGKEGEMVFQVSDNAPSPQELLEKKETAELVRRAVCHLEPRLRAIIILRHFRDMDYRQISETLNIPIGTVKNRLFRAREKLQSILLSGNVV